MIDTPTTFYETIQESKIVIPIIQRDYAQGRKTPRITKIREKFIDALFDAITGQSKPIELDFIYGYNIEEDKIKKFIPLDGQQRLTTLFLLHYYSAMVEDKLALSKNILRQFTYEVRHSSKVFCEKLIEFNNRDLTESIDEAITNQSWFFTEWNNDPTVASMLEVLKYIEHKYRQLNCTDVWERITREDAPIKFYCLPMEKLGLADSLYIKMNSRGKPLTDFEHFKSNFSNYLKPEHKIIFNYKIDKEWSDMFWEITRNGNVENEDFALKMDNGTLRFIAYISDILVSKENIELAGESDLLLKAKIIYQDHPDRVDFLFNCLNVFSGIKSFEKFSKDLFYLNPADFAPNKVRLFFRSKNENLLQNCISGYGSNSFTFGERLMLYAIIIHKLKDTASFTFRIRVLRNVIENSEDEMREEHYSNFLNSTSELIINGVLPSDNRFNTKQVNEELNKEKYLEKNKNLENELYKLEDHSYLRGNLALFDLDDTFQENAIAFLKYFKGEFDLLSRALMTFGDYSKQINEYIFDYGSRNDHWRNIFVPNRNFDFGNTKTTINKFLKNCIVNKESKENIIGNYLTLNNANTNSLKPFEYYYVAYDEFRFKEYQYGYYQFFDREDTSKYERYKMNKRQFNGLHWSPFLVAIHKRTKSTALENSGAYYPLELNVKGAKFSFWIDAQGFLLDFNKGANVDSILEYLRKEKIMSIENIILVKQNGEGIDLEDRIKLGINVINKIIDFSKMI